MRAFDYVAIAAKDIRRQVVRSLLTITALSISTMVLVAMLAISSGGQQAISSQFSAGNSLSLITVTPNQSSASLNPFGSIQEVNDGAAKLSDETVRQLLTIPHVVTASPRAGIWELHHFVIEDSSKQFVAQAQGVPSDSNLSLSAGRMFLGNDAKNEVIVGSNYLKEVGISPQAALGKSIQLVTQKGYRGDGAAIPATGATQAAIEAFNQKETVLPATIVGVTADGPDQNALLLPLGWARALKTAQYNEASGVKKIDQLETDGYSFIRIHADSPENVEGVSEIITDFGYGQASTKEQLLRFEQFTTTMWIVLGCVALIAIVAAALGVANAMLTTVSEQGYSIAVWRAVGARRHVVLRLFLMQALLLGVIGGMVGVFVGAVLSGYINSYINSLLISQGLVQVNTVLLPWWLLCGAVLLTTLFAVIAGFFPARKAAKADPSAALRSS
jgi:putative ABC transport system permease protein